MSIVCILGPSASAQGHPERKSLNHEGYEEHEEMRAATVLPQIPVGCSRGHLVVGEPCPAQTSLHSSCSSCSSWFNLFGFDATLPYHVAMKNPESSANPVVRLKIERRSKHPWTFQ